MGNHFKLIFHMMMLLSQPMYFNQDEKVTRPPRQSKIDFTDQDMRLSCLDDGP